MREDVGRDQRRARLTGLQVSNSILEGHRSDGDASIQLVLIEIEPPDSSSVDSSAFSLESSDEFDGLDLGGSRNGSSREDGSEGVKSERRMRKTGIEGWVESAKREKRGKDE